MKDVRGIEYKVGDLVGYYNKHYGKIVLRNVAKIEDGKVYLEVIHQQWRGVLLRPLEKPELHVIVDVS